MNNIVLKFLQETLQRIFVKMPKFFKAWAWISGALLIVTGLPDFITMLPGDIKIPNLFNEYITTAVKWASTGLLLMSFLTTQSKAVAVTPSGEVLKVTDEKKLPFTAASEKEEADKTPKSIVVPITKTTTEEVRKNPPINTIL